KSQLPVDAQDPIITRTADVPAVLGIAFTSTDVSRAALADYINRVAQPMLAQVPGVASADSVVTGVFAMRLWLDPSRMAARGLTADDVVTALRDNNVQSA